MLKRISAVHVFAAGLVATALLFAIGWTNRDDPAQKPYLAILGGGFVISYPVTDFRYGFSARVEKPLAVGSIIEAIFEDPAGGPPLIESVRVSARTTRYSLRSPSVHGVEAGKRYRVVVRVYDYRHENLLETHEKTYASQVGDRQLLPVPLPDGQEYNGNQFTTRS